jgi:hypothetical protein
VSSQEAPRAPRVNVRACCGGRGAEVGRHGEPTGHVLMGREQELC